MRRLLPVAVIVPASCCACDQIGQILPQLGARDRIVVVRNGRSIGHDCGGGLGRSGKVVVLGFERRIGAAAARNAGVVKVGGEAEIYAFADADDRVGGTWLTTLVAPVVEGRADVVGGALAVQGRRGGARVVPGRDYWHAQALFGGNLALSARAWRVLGGFDTSFGCCEDTDLSWRAAEVGLRIEVEETAIVHVAGRSTLGEMIQRYWWGSWSVYLLCRHGVSIDHLPGLKELVLDKVRSGYCRWPMGAAMGQWCGQLAGRWCWGRRGRTVDG